MFTGVDVAGERAPTVDGQATGYVAHWYLVRLCVEVSGVREGGFNRVRMDATGERAPTVDGQATGYVAHWYLVRLYVEG